MSEPVVKFVTTSSGPGNIRFQTPSAILAFAPLKTAFINNNPDVTTNAENIYKSSSNAASGSTISSAGGYTLLDWTDTRLYYLGANLLIPHVTSAYGWGSSANSSYSGSFHNPLFWMYTSASTFSLNHTNLYYTTFQSRSTDQGFVETGSLPNYLAQVQAFNISLTTDLYSQFTLPPITSPAYNYQLIVSRSVQLYNTTGNSAWRTIKDWTCTADGGGQNTGTDPDPTQYQKDSLRSGSSSTDKTLNGANVQGNFNTSSGFYFFVRNNLPGQDTTYIRSIPLEYTFSAEIEQISPTGYTMSFGITSASLQSNNTLVSQSSPLIFSSKEISGGSGYVPVTWSGSFDLFQQYPNQLSTNGLSITDTSSIASNSREGIIFQLSASSFVKRIQSASLEINQPLTGRQVAFPIPIDTVTTSPTSNDTGSYLVVTPYLNFGASSSIPDPNTSGLNFDRTIYSGSLNKTTQFDFKFAVYYFKTAYALWRDGWRVTARRGSNQSNTTSDQLNWLNASSCPSWAARASSNGLAISSIYVRNPGWLYASRSANNAFIDYGTSSTDPAVRNRSYVGIAAELLGGSELITHLKGAYNGPGEEGTSASFAGAQFGGAIVVKTSRVSFSSSVAGERAIPSSTANGHIYYYPGIASSSAGFTITNAVDNTIAAVGLPLTMVNDCDVVPLSLWYYDPTLPDKLSWPTNISGWPRTEVGNYYTASDALYGYDGYTF